MIPIKKEPEEVPSRFGEWIERCVFCGVRTLMWHVESNTPVCVACAEVKEVSEIQKYKKV